MTINVSRELLADLLGNDHDKRIMAERHLLAMLANAPSPAGVDGCKGKNCGATDGVSHSDECIAEHEQACGRADLNGLPVVAYLIGGEPSLTPCPVCGVVNEPLCRLSDAKAIIDGLRGEVERLREERDSFQRVGIRTMEQRDRLAGLLLYIRRNNASSLSTSMIKSIDAALSAGKDSAK